MRGLGKAFEPMEKEPAIVDGKVSYEEKRVRTVAQRIAWEVLGGSSAGRNIVIINDAEPCLCAGSLNTLFFL